MNKNFDKYKVIQTLFAVAVVLVIANLLVGRFNSEIDFEHKLEFDKNINPSKIDSIFLASLRSYNIRQDWIHQPSINKNKNKSTLYIYKIDVPNDLPNILLIKEIFKNLSETKLLVTSKELKVGGTSFLEISNGNKLILTAVLTYNKDISHLSGYLNLLVILPDDLENEDKNDLLNSTKNITLLFSPSTSKISLANQVFENKKPYALIIDNNIEELKFKIKNSFNKSRINQGINAIAKSFPHTKFVLIANGFNPNYNVRSAFKKMKIKLLYQKNLIDFTKEYKGELNKLFKSYVASIGENDTLNTILSANNFFRINSDLKKYYKLGYKFVSY